VITYEASLVCDKCKTAIAGECASHPMHARTSAIKAGRDRDWFIGAGGAVLCPDCKHTSSLNPYEVPRKNKS